MAGLLSARVLAPHFAVVTVLERDVPCAEQRFRPGLPQGRHFHGLLPGGLHGLQALFPEFGSLLVAAGSLQPRPEQLYVYRPEGVSYAVGYHQPEPPDEAWAQPLYVQTRGLLERCVREQVSALPNVVLRSGARVADLLVEHGRVCGARLQGGEVLRADLVIDALGRNTKTPSWLAAMGYTPAPEEKILCDLAYSTAVGRFKEPAGFLDVGFFVFSNPTSNHPRRGGALIRVEGGEVLVSLTGRYGDYPPTDFMEFKDWATTLEHPRLAELARLIEPAGELAHYRFRHSIRRRYDRLVEFPPGLLPIGDAISFYNPLYGQGMSAACRQALALQRALAVATGAQALRELWREFLPEAYQETRAPWLFAALADFRDPACQGSFPGEERPHLKSLLALRKRAVAGDKAAAQTFAALSGLELRLDSSSWRE